MSYKEIKGYCNSCEKELYGRKRLYCDVECRNAVLYPLYAYDNHGRTCAHCGALFIGKENYCSTQCKKVVQYENNKNEYYNPRTEASTNLYRDYSVSTVALPNKISAIVDDLPDSPCIVEDTQELDRIIAGELSKAKYADGRVYQPEVSRETLRRMKALNSIAYEKGEYISFGHDSERVKEIRINGKRKKFMVVDEKESTSDTFTKN